MKEVGDNIEKPEAIEKPENNDKEFSKSEVGRECKENVDASFENEKPLESSNERDAQEPKNEGNPNDRQSRRELLHDVHKEPDVKSTGNDSPHTPPVKEIGYQQ
jgi:hypothetical protein